MVSGENNISPYATAVRIEISLARISVLGFEGGGGNGISKNMIFISVYRQVIHGQIFDFHDALWLLGLGTRVDIPPKKRPIERIFVRIPL